MDAHEVVIELVSSCVVKEEVINDNPLPRLEGIKSLLDEKELHFVFPVMKYITEEDSVKVFREVLCQKVKRLEANP
jgi:hypothetical protein